MSVPVRTVTTVEALFTDVRRAWRDWNTATFPWFRGEPLNVATPLLPVLFREPRRHDENRLLQRFRMKAPSLGLTSIPPRDHTDQWLFLAQHVGLPTRLLDWTEGLLVALFFALYDARGGERSPSAGATVWMLDPVELNRRSTPSSPSRDNEFPLTWINAPTEPPTREELLAWFTAATDMSISDKAQHFRDIHVPPNIGSMNIRRAWGAPGGTELPVAIHATAIHPRITAQKGCFTIHGLREQPMPDLVDERVLRQYSIDSASLVDMRSDLRMAGVTYSTIFPDLDGLAVDLRSWF